jgi:hypothetical protein
LQQYLDDRIIARRIARELRLAKQGIDLRTRQSFAFRSSFSTNQLHPCCRIQGKIALIDQPSAPGAQGTDPQINRADGFVLFMLEFVAVANQRNRVTP